MNKTVAKFDKEFDVVQFVKMQRLIRVALKTLITDMQQSYDQEKSLTTSIKGSPSSIQSEEKQMKQFEMV